MLTPMQFYVLTRISFRGECWEWDKATDKDGYGIGWWKKKIPAHRISFHAFVYEPSSGQHIDHLCRNRLCVNPLHLEEVTLQENNSRGNSPSALNARKTHCVNGHEFSLENTRNRADGKRDCRICFNTRRRENRARLRASA